MPDLDPQKHQPRINFPSRHITAGETLRVNCTSAPALPAPHITWFINGNKVDELMVHAHKYPVSVRERGARRPRQHRHQPSPPPLLALTHSSHAATHPPGCGIHDAEIGEMLSEGANMVRSASRHRSRRPARGRELYITISELQLVATGRLEIACVSTIPEFRSIDDKFADLRNDSAIVDVFKPATLSQPSANMTKKAEEGASYGSAVRSALWVAWLCAAAPALRPGA
ncbi:hypothetical protein EVAR_39692_1 [Eumeta japonica]|uniref:Ig-like domain-containing protein n=1 Tax=Eumeta variegata TaxID=151549 RepID=A0A4C1W843_EUMVA|nr:hypothetical protein EVAR_39692_1 [Eumeta japonica]